MLQEEDWEERERPPSNKETTRFGFTFTERKISQQKQKDKNVARDRTETRQLRRQAGEARCMLHGEDAQVFDLCCSLDYLCDLYI